jgi:hypothetical protein
MGGFIMSIDVLTEKSEKVLGNGVTRVLPVVVIDNKKYEITCFRWEECSKGPNGKNEALIKYLCSCDNEHKCSTYRSRAYH